jgi:hypothetical protein
LYPNPSSDLIRIQKIPSPSRFVIFDLTGKTVAKGGISTEKPLVDISHLPSGTYLLQVSTSQGEITTQQIIKE